MLTLVIILLVSTAADGLIISNQSTFCSQDYVTITCSGYVENIQWTYSGNILILEPDSRCARFSPKCFEVVNYRNSSGFLQSNITFQLESMDNGRQLDCGFSDIVQIVLMVMDDSLQPNVSWLTRQAELVSSNASILFLEWIITNAIKPPTVMVSGNSMYEDAKNSTYLSIRNFTIMHNERYLVQVTVSSCITKTFNFSIVEEICLFPSLQQVVTWPNNFAANGSLVYYRCKLNFFPEENYRSMCVIENDTATWIPEPSLNCSKLCDPLPSTTDVVYLDTSDMYLENVTVLFACNISGFNDSYVQLTQCTQNGTWVPDPGRKCAKLVTFFANTMSTQTLVYTDEGIMESHIELIGGVAGGLVVIAVVTTLIIVIFIFWKARAGKETKGSMPQNHPNKDDVEYAKTVHMTILKSGSSTNDDEEYARTNHVTNINPGSPPMYSKLSQKQVSDSKNTALVYAELSSEKNLMCHTKSHLDAVTYSEINFKSSNGTKHNADAMLDLNTLLIQVAEVSQHWKSFSNNLGVPTSILDQIDSMNIGDYDKMVEALDYWLHMSFDNLSPTWKIVANALTITGFESLATEILKVYSTGNLPVVVKDDAMIPAPSLPPPLPPKDTVNNNVNSNIISEQGSDNLPPPIPPKMH